MAARLSDLLSLLLQAASQPIASAFKPSAKKRNFEDQDSPDSNPNSKQAPNFNQSGLDLSEIFKTIVSNSNPASGTGTPNQAQASSSSIPNPDPFASEELGTLLLQSELNQAGALVDGVTQDDLLRYVLNPSAGMDFSNFFPGGSSMQRMGGSGNQNQFSNMNQAQAGNRNDGGQTGEDLNMNDWLRWNDENLRLD